jgi:hypothetical protein
MALLRVDAMSHATKAIEKLFAHIPENAGIHIFKAKNNQLCISIEHGNERYAPKINEVDSCLKALAALTQIQPG